MRHVCVGKCGVVIWVFLVGLLNTCCKMHSSDLHVLRIFEGGCRVMVRVNVTVRFKVKAR